MVLARELESEQCLFPRKAKSWQSQTVSKGTQNNYFNNWPLYSLSYLCLRVIPLRRQCSCVTLVAFFVETLSWTLWSIFTCVFISNFTLAAESFSTGFCLANHSAHRLLKPWCKLRSSEVHSLTCIHVTCANTSVHAHTHAYTQIISLLHICVKLAVNFPTGSVQWGVDQMASFSRAASVLTCHSSTHGL